MEKAPVPVIFADESAGITIALAGHDLPEPPIQWGGTHRKTVTRYAHDHVSVQSHGIDLETVEISGDLKDQRWGIEGHAQQIRNNLEALMHARGVVKIEYETDKLWGSFEVTFEEIRRDFIRYKIKFEPYWSEDPAFRQFFDLSLETEAVSGRLDARTKDIFGFADLPPDSIIDTKWLSQMRLGILSVQNDVNGVIGILQDAANFQQMAIDNVNLVKRGALSAAGALQKGLERNRDLSIESISTAGAPLVVTADFVWTLSQKQRFLMSDLLDLIRRILSEREPVATRNYIVRLGDTLQRIAARELGDFGRWVDIADANDLETTEITVGQKIVLPGR